MADPRPEFVARFQGRVVFYFLFVISVLYVGWFGFVLFGENQGYGDDPGRWAILPTTIWAYIGVALLVLFLAYALAVLTIREKPARVYRLEEDAALNAEPMPPSFLQPQEPPAETATTDEPGQG